MSEIGLTIPFLAIGFLGSLPYWVIVSGVMVLIALWVLVKWGNHMSRIRNPLDKELTQASHGAALILLCPLLVHFAFLERWTNLLPPSFRPFVWPSCWALMGLGAFWLIVCAMRTRTNFRDAQLIARAVVKFAVGVGLGWSLYQHILPQPTWPYRHYIYLALLFTAMFCVITGVVKFVLLMCGPLGERKDRPPSGDLPDAGFGTGEGFR